MTTRDIAEDLVRLYNSGQVAEIGDKYLSPDIVSIEPMAGPMHRCEGVAAVKAKGDWWFSAHEIHSTSAGSHYVNGDQFAVRFAMDVTNKESGQRMQMDEIGLYMVKDDKIVEERFFY